MVNQDENIVKDDLDSKKLVLNTPNMMVEYAKISIANT